MLLLLLAGCASDGRTLAEPEDWQTTTTRPLPPTSAPPQEESQTGLSLSSPDFAAGGEAPEATTCRDNNQFPNLRWSQLPTSAAEVVVVLSDQTNPEEPLLLWLMAGINPTATSLDAGTLPAGAFESLNDYGNHGYGSPCIDELGSGPRDLQFRVYVLNEPSGLAPQDPGNQAWETVKARSVDTASLLMRVNESSP